MKFRIAHSALTLAMCALAGACRIPKSANDGRVFFHNAHQNPQAIAEVLRILKLHMP